MYILHGIPDWGSQVIRMALEELAVPYRFSEVDWQTGGLTTPAYLAMNPLGRVPVLETPDGVMFETAAILLYLCERHGALAPAPGDADRALFLIWFIFVTNQLHPTAMMLLHPERPGGAAVQRRVADETHRLIREQLTLLNRLAATETPWWLSPDRPSATSLYAIMLLRWLKAFPAYAAHSVPSADYPALHRLAQGLEARPAIRRTLLQAEGIADPAAFSDPPCETAPE